MFNKAKKLFIIPLIAVVGFGSLTLTTPVTTYAVDDIGETGPLNANSVSVCTLFPFLDSIKLFNIGPTLCGQSSSAGEEIANATANTIQLVLQLIFVAIIGIAVFVIIKAAIKYIRSEGDETKVKDAQSAIKTVFIGVAALFVGIIGIVLVLAFFQASGAVSIPDSGNESITGIELIDGFLRALLGR